MQSVQLTENVIQCRPTLEHLMSKQLAATTSRFRNFKMMNFRTTKILPSVQLTVLDLSFDFLYQGQSAGGMETRLTFNSILVGNF